MGQHTRARARAHARRRRRWGLRRWRGVECAPAATRARSDESGGSEADLRRGSCTSRAPGTARVRQCTWAIGSSGRGHEGRGQGLAARPLAARPPRRTRCSSSRASCTSARTASSYSRLLRTCLYNKRSQGPKALYDCNSRVEVRWPALGLDYFRLVETRYVELT